MVDLRSQKKIQKNFSNFDERKLPKKNFPLDLHNTSQC